METSLKARAAIDRNRLNAARAHFKLRRKGMS